MSNAAPRLGRHCCMLPRTNTGGRNADRAIGVGIVIAMPCGPGAKEPGGVPYEPYEPAAADCEIKPGCIALEWNSLLSVCGDLCLSSIKTERFNRDLDASPEVMAIQGLCQRCKDANDAKHANLDNPGHPG